ncbi:hypothetical protein BFF94_037970 [Burkholderia catarinensis]|nr:hypothetical protein BFF94_037970 [Burkholderia catarinensis]
MLSQLENLKKQIDEARENEARLIADRVIQLLAENGFPFCVNCNANLGQEKSRRGAVKPKYFDPNSGATWSGRGRMPVWLIGKDLDKYRLKE